MTAPRASLLRRLSWWLRGGPARLRAAQVRREAIHGDPLVALKMRLGRGDVADFMIHAWSNSSWNLRDRENFYRRAVLRLTPRAPEARS